MGLSGFINMVVSSIQILFRGMKVIGQLLLQKVFKLKYSVFSAINFSIRFHTLSSCLGHHVCIQKVKLSITLQT